MYEDVLNFWFNEIKSYQWWKKDKQFDHLIRERFLGVHDKAISGELAKWRNSFRGRLAEIIILDQFSRNIYRNTPLAYKNDKYTLILSQNAIKNGIEKKINDEELLFIYMPFMHSESISKQIVSVDLFKKLGLKKNIKSALRHYDVIQKFGRFPHRNIILNRKSTVEEKEFLSKPGSRF